VVAGESKRARTIAPGKRILFRRGAPDVRSVCQMPKRPSCVFNNFLGSFVHICFFPRQTQWFRATWSGTVYSIFNEPWGVGL
jgi:hypothetical protein